MCNGLFRNFTNKITKTNNVEPNILETNITDSSVIERLRFLKDTETLIITFKGINKCNKQSHYSYPIGGLGGMKFYTQFVNAPSKGKFFYENFRAEGNKYSALSNKHCEE
jgi:hypothetical protein